VELWGKLTAFGSGGYILDFAPNATEPESLIEFFNNTRVRILLTYVSNHFKRANNGLMNTQGKQWKSPDILTFTEH
jgi:hypothetical protein